MAHKTLSLALAALVLSACVDTATQPTEVTGPSFARTSAPADWQEVNFTRFDNCNGEFVDFETKRKWVTTITNDGARGFHVGLHRAWRGTGVGQDTGTEYTLNWPWQQQQYTRGFPFTLTRTANNNLISKGKADNRIFKGTRHITVNANGDVTVDFNDITLECVG